MNRLLRIRLVFIAALILCLAPLTGLADGAKKPLTYIAYDGWRSIQGTQIARDGSRLVYALVPQEGDSELVVRDLKTDKEFRAARGKDPVLTMDGKFVVFTIAPPKAETDKAKKEKKKAEDQPKGGLGIMNVATGEVTAAERVKSFKIAEESGAYVAYLLEPPVKKDADKKDEKTGEIKKEEAKKEEPKKEPAVKEPEKKEPEKKEDAKKPKAKKKDPGDDLIIRELATGKTVTVAEVQQQLAQAQKMEAVGRLAGGVAHDFNNLLQALISHVELLRSRSNDPEKVKSSSREMEQLISHGASLTRQLLLFSRRETVKPERLDLNEQVREASKMLKRLVKDNITLRVELAPESLRVDADRGQLDQVLMNLVVNASDAMPDGGELTIRTGTTNHTRVWLSVEDNGLGIPEEIRERIFEPFFTTKGAGKGTGLGLSVVHGIVNRHGGLIEVESDLGRGTTFKVILPAAGSGEFPAAKEAQQAAAELPVGKGERILVVEDEELARQGLHDILVSFNYEVVSVGSGEAAGSLPADHPFDLLLTDLMLPGVAGPQLAIGLKERWPALKVILMSGYTEDETIRSGVGDGTLRFLQKPFDMETLAREVRAALEDSA